MRTSVVAEAARGARGLFAALVVAGSVLTGCAPVPAPVRPAAADVEWPDYGGDPGGRRWSPAAQITPANVGALREAWRFSTGEVARLGPALGHAAFEDTPLMTGGRLFVCSPFNEVFALDPASGRELWRFDPHIDPSIHYPNTDTCRGLAHWRDPVRPAGPCADRIFLATNDRRLFALDAATGRTCAGFGRDGAVDVAEGVRLARPGEMQITSPPLAALGAVIVGSSIDDNQRLVEVSGAVRAFDARTGAPLWRFDPLASAAGVQAGAANVWAPMSADLARGLVFLPTTSPSPDFWGGARPGDGGDADAIVALDIRTGRKVWTFHTVLHDVWDYDNPAQPTLATIGWGGRPREAVLEPTKQGLLFTLGRADGQPVIPVRLVPAPGGGAPGERLSSVQPVPVAPAPLAPSALRPEDAFGLTPFDRAWCRRRIAEARNDGLFTPPSLRGSLIFPFDGGGTNWGGLAFDPDRQVAFVNTSSLVHIVRLFPAARLAAERAADPDGEVSPQAGAPFGMSRKVLRSPLGLPCNPPPWGQLHAVDMRTGRILWSTPLGTTGDLAPGSQFLLRGSGAPNFGGPLATGSGLVFIGATVDDYIRAFAAADGREIWRARLPAGGQATPMTYVWKGRQYVVIASGGHAKSGTRRGDTVVAYALP